MKMEREILRDEDNPTVEEMELLDRELEEFQRNQEEGSSWEEVEARLRRPTQT